MVIDRQMGLVSASRSRALLLCLSAWTLLSPAANAAESPEWQACIGSPQYSLDQQIAGCTSVITSGREIPGQLAKAFYSRGTAYSQKGDHIRAIQDFTDAIRLNPGYADAYYNRGAAYNSKGDYERAIKDFNEAIRLVPDYAKAYNNRGNAYANKGDYDRAIQDYNEAIRLKPGFAEAYNNRGNTYTIKGQYDLAIQDYNRAVSNPKYSTPALGYANRGYAWFKKGTLPDLDRAIADIEQALRIDPNLTYAKSYLTDARAARDALIAQAQAQTTGRRIALVIGNSTYANAGPLPNAVNDAREVAGALKALGYEIFGYDRTNFTKAALEREIAEFRAAAVGSTAAIIWYSGHGQMMVEKDNPNIRDWIIPVDASIKTDADVAGNAISLDALKLSVIAAKKLRLVVVDACRDNKFASGTRGAGRFLDPTKLDGVVVIYSTSPGDVARDGPSGGNSPFAKAFIDTVKAKPATDIRLLFGEVSGLTKTRTGNPPQRPIVESGLETAETIALKD